MTREIVLVVPLSLAPVRVPRNGRSVEKTRQATVVRTGRFRSKAEGLVSGRGSSIVVIYLVKGYNNTNTWLASGSIPLD
jgi:hypothetical protein